MRVMAGYLCNSCPVSISCELDTSHVDKRGLVRMARECTEEVLEVMVTCWTPDQQCTGLLNLHKHNMTGVNQNQDHCTTQNLSLFAYMF